MNPLGLRRSWRHLNRYQEILKVLVKYGFYDVVEKIRVGLLFDISKKILPHLEKKELATLGTAVRLRMVLEERGPTFIKLGQMLSIRPELIRNFRIKLPPDLVMMGKALAISEGVGRKLYPEFNMFELIVPYSEKLLLHRLDPFYQFKHFTQFIETGIDLLANLPDDFRLTLTKLKKDQITIKFQHQGLEHLTRELDCASNRLAFSLIIAALIIGYSMLIQFKKGPFLWGYPAPGIIGFVLASILGVWLLISIMRSGKL
jgi:ubiquinone biosynthesis protein